MKFTISNIPMPPSSNHQYFATAFMKDGRPFGKIAPSRELKTYVADFAAWAKREEVLLAKARKFIREEILLKDKMLKVDTYACFPGTSLWTLKSQAKKMDGTNRIKALHDCLAEVLQVDDSWFWQGSFEKLESRKPDPWCFVTIKPWEPRGVQSIDPETL